MCLATVIAFLTLVVELTHSDAYVAHVYWPLLPTGPQMHVASENCSRIARNEILCWPKESDEGKIEFKITAPCDQPVILGISQWSRTRGGTWQTVIVDDPQPCLRNQIYFPMVGRND